MSNSDKEIVEALLLEDTENNVSDPEMAPPIEDELPIDNIVINDTLDVGLSNSANDQFADEDLLNKSNIEALISEFENDDGDFLDFTTSSHVSITTDTVTQINDIENELEGMLDIQLMSLNDVTVLEDNIQNSSTPSIIAPITRRRLHDISANSEANRISLLTSTEQKKIFNELEKGRKFAGEPICSAIHTRFIAIATSKGFIFVFDNFQSLHCVLGATKGQLSDLAVRGPAYALDFSPDGEHLVSGHKNGHIILWNIHEKALLRVINEFSTASISEVLFTCRGKIQFLVVDILGVCSLVTVSKSFFGFSSYSHNIQCLIQGKAGQILSASVLHSNPSTANPTDEYALLALATEMFTLLISLEPVVKIITKISKDTADIANSVDADVDLDTADRTNILGSDVIGDINVVPCIAWKAAKNITVNGMNILNNQFDSPRSSNDASSDSPDSENSDHALLGLPADVWSQQPLLAVARGNVIQLFCAISVEMYNSTMYGDMKSLPPLPGQQTPASAAAASALGQPPFPIRFEKVGNMGLNLNVLSLHWLNNQLLLALTHRKQIIAIDILNLSVIDHFDINNMIFNPHQLFRPVRVNPQPSFSPSKQPVSQQTPASQPPATPRLCFKPCICSCDTGIFILGLNDCISLKVLQWHDRVSLLSSISWVSAFSLALDFFFGNSKSSLGLPINPKVRRRFMMEKLTDLIIDYVDTMIKKRNLKSWDTDPIASPTSPDLNEEENKNIAIVAGIVIDLCISINRIDHLFKLIAPRFTRYYNDSLFTASESMASSLASSHLASVDPDKVSISLTFVDIVTTYILKRYISVVDTRVFDILYMNNIAYRRDCVAGALGGMNMIKDSGSFGKYRVFFQIVNNLDALIIAFTSVYKYNVQVNRTSGLTADKTDYSRDGSTDPYDITTSKPLYSRAWPLIDFLLNTSSPMQAQHQSSKFLSGPSNTTDIWGKKKNPKTEKLGVPDLENNNTNITEIITRSYSTYYNPVLQLLHAMITSYGPHINDIINIIHIATTLVPYNDKLAKLPVSITSQPTPSSNFSTSTSVTGLLGESFEDSTAIPMNIPNSGSTSLSISSPSNSLSPELYFERNTRLFDAPTCFQQLTRGTMSIVSSLNHVMVTSLNLGTTATKVNNLMKTLKLVINNTMGKDNIQLLGYSDDLIKFYNSSSNTSFITRNNINTNTNNIILSLLLPYPVVSNKLHYYINNNVHLVQFLNNSVRVSQPPSVQSQPHTPFIQSKPIGSMNPSFVGTPTVVSSVPNSTSVTSTTSVPNALMNVKDIDITNLPAELLLYSSLPQSTQITLQTPNNNATPVAATTTKPTTTSMRAKFLTKLAETTSSSSIATLATQQQQSAELKKLQQQQLLQPTVVSPVVTTDCGVISLLSLYRAQFLSLLFHNSSTCGIDGNENVNMLSNGMFLEYDYLTSNPPDPLISSSASHSLMHTAFTSIYFQTTLPVSSRYKPKPIAPFKTGSVTASSLTNYSLGNISSLSSSNSSFGAESIPAPSTQTLSITPSHTPTGGSSLNDPSAPSAHPMTSDLSFFNLRLMLLLDAPVLLSLLFVICTNQSSYSSQILPKTVATNDNWQTLIPVSYVNSITNMILSFNHSSSQPAEPSIKSSVVQQHQHYIMGSYLSTSILSNTSLLSSSANFDDVQNSVNDDSNLKSSIFNEKDINLTVSRISNAITSFIDKNDTMSSILDSFDTHFKNNSDSSLSRQLFNVIGINKDKDDDKEAETVSSSSLPLTPPSTMSGLGAALKDSNISLEPRATSLSSSQLSLTSTTLDSPDGSLTTSPQKSSNQSPPARPGHNVSIVDKALSLYAPLLPLPVPSIPLLVLVLCKVLQLQAMSVSLLNTIIHSTKFPVTNEEDVSDCNTLFDRKVQTTTCTVNLTNPTTPNILHNYRRHNISHPQVMMMSLMLHLMKLEVLPIDMLPKEVIPNLLMFLCKCDYTLYNSIITGASQLVKFNNDTSDSREPSISLPPSTPAVIAAFKVECEELVLKLLSLYSNTLSSSLTTLSKMAEDAGFRKVSLLLFRQSGQVGKVIEGYLKLINSQTIKPVISDKLGSAAVSAEKKFTTDHERLCLVSISANVNGINFLKYDPNTIATINELFDYLATINSSGFGLNKNRDNNVAITTKSLVLSLFPQIVQIAPAGAARIATSIINTNGSNALLSLTIDDVLNSLSNDPQSHYAFLAAMFAVKDVKLVNAAVSHHHNNVVKRIGDLNLNIAVNNPQTLGELFDQFNFNLSSKMNENYIELLCQYCPEKLYDHLNAHNNFDLERALKTCISYNIKDATAYLYERVGDVAKSMELLLNIITENLQKLQHHINENATTYIPSVRSVLEHIQDVNDKYITVPTSLVNIVDSDFSSQLEKSVLSCMQLCMRTSDNEKLWCLLLEALVNAQLLISNARKHDFDQQVSNADKVKNKKKKSTSSKTMMGAVYDLKPLPSISFSKSFLLFSLFESLIVSNINTVMDNIINYISPNNILNRIIVLYRNNNLNDCRRILQTMLENYAYEVNILNSSRTLLKRDLMKNIEKKFARSRSAFNNNSTYGLFMKSLETTTTMTHNGLMKPNFPNCNPTLTSTTLRTHTGLEFCCVCKQKLLNKIEVTTSSKSIDVVHELENKGIFPDNCAGAIFSCGHVYHYNCLTRSSCVICDSLKGPSNTNSNSINEENDNSSKPNTGTPISNDVIILQNAREVLRNKQWVDFKDVLEC